MQVGTAYVRMEETEPTRGRILVLSVEDDKLHLVTEFETKGAVYNLNAFQGKLLAGINARIQLFRWAQCDGTHELVPECSHHGNILVRAACKVRRHVTHLDAYPSCFEY